LGDKMSDRTILLARAAKLRRDAQQVRKEAALVSLAEDRKLLFDVAKSMETDAQHLEREADKASRPQP